MPRTTRAAFLATMDWVAECRRCGRSPLSIFNKCGYCRECSRRHMRLGRKPKARVTMRDRYGRFRRAA